MNSPANSQNFNRLRRPCALGFRSRSPTRGRLATRFRRYREPGLRSLTRPGVPSGGPGACRPAGTIVHCRRTIHGRFSARRARLNDPANLAELDGWDPRKTSWRTSRRSHKRIRLRAQATSAANGSSVQTRCRRRGDNWRRVATESGRVHPPRLRPHGASRDCQRHSASISVARSRIKAVPSTVQCPVSSATTGASASAALAPTTK